MSKVFFADEMTSVLPTAPLTHFQSPQVSKGLPIKRFVAICYVTIFNKVLYYTYVTFFTICYDPSSISS